MRRNEDIQKELEGIAPDLSRIDKHEPFQPPANYFDTLASEVIRKVHTGERPAARYAWLSWANLVPKLAVAVVFGAVIYLGWHFWKPAPEQNGEAQYAMETFILENVDADILIESYADLQLGMTGQPIEETSMDDLIIQEIDEETIMEEL